jgi:hypothetical protein
MALLMIRQPIRIIVKRSAETGASDSPSAVRQGIHHFRGQIVGQKRHGLTLGAH